MKAKYEDPFIEIKQEIEKYSPNYLNEFMKYFPCNRKNCFIKIPNYIYFLVNGKEVGKVEMTWKNSHLKQQYVIYSDNKDFWYRWNRFKQLKLFL